LVVLLDVVLQSWPLPLPLPYGGGWPLWLSLLHGGLVGGGFGVPLLLLWLANATPGPANRATTKSASAMRNSFRT
jgi:hypothetical protein